MDNLGWIAKDLKREKKEKMEKEKEEEKTYANPILYLHRSKKGGHLFAFNIEKKNEDSIDFGGDGMVLGDYVGSLLMNVSDVTGVITGQMKWCKVSVLKAKGEGGKAKGEEDVLSLYLQAKEKEEEG